VPEFTIVVYAEPLDALANLDAPARSGSYQTMAFSGMRVGAGVCEDESETCQAVRLYHTSDDEYVVTFDRFVPSDAGLAAYEFVDDAAEFARTFPTLHEVEVWLREEMGASVDLVASVIKGAHWVMKNP
jgi:hypothetical protein